MEHVLQSWGYLAIFALTFISGMALPVGAEAAILYGGVLASGQIPHEPHHLNVVLVMVVSTGGEVLGSLVGYLIGSHGGRPLVDRLGKYVLLTHRDLDRAEAWFGRRGAPLVLFGRFIPLLRSFVSIAAGLGEMAIGTFLPLTLVGCGIWCVGFSSAGYALGSSYEHVLKAFSDAGYVIGVLAVVAVVLLFLHRLRAVRRERVAGRAPVGAAQMGPRARAGRAAGTGRAVPAPVGAALRPDGRPAMAADRSQGAARPAPARRRRR